MNADPNVVAGCLAEARQAIVDAEAKAQANQRATRPKRSAAEIAGELVDLARAVHDRTRPRSRRLAAARRTPSRAAMRDQR
jgi:hypothetical protein